MHGPSRLPAAAMTLAPVVAAATSLFLVIGCGTSVNAEYSPAAATEAVQRNLDPPATQLECLKGRFEREPEIAAVYNVTEKASTDQRDGYVRAIRACIPIEDFAALVAAAFVPADSPADVASDTTSRCVHDAIVRASTAEQDRLYLYFSNPAAIDADDIAPTTRAMSAACGLDTRSGQSGSTAPNAATSTAVTPSQ